MKKGFGSCAILARPIEKETPDDFARTLARASITIRADEIVQIVIQNLSDAVDRQVGGRMRERIRRS